MKKYLLILVFGLVMSGCLAKTATPYKYYEITYKGSVCKQKISNPVEIYVANIQALNLADSRDILVVDTNNNIKYLPDAKFVTLPSEMVYKSIVSAIESECGYRQIFSPSRDARVLNTSLISLQVNANKAEVIIGYDLIENAKTIKSGVIKNHIDVPNESSETIISHLDKSVNEAVKKLVNEIR